MRGRALVMATCAQRAHVPSRCALTKHVALIRRTQARLLRAWLAARENTADELRTLGAQLARPTAA